MKKLLGLVALASMIAAGCDSPLTTRRVVAEIEITPADIHLPALRSTQLQPVLRDERGAPLTGTFEIRWSSSDTTVVSVSPSGLVTARTGGSARVTATVGTASGDAVVSVAVPLPEECTSVVDLPVGGVLAAPAGSGSVLCFEGGAAGAEFTLIPFFGSNASGSTVALDVSVRGGQRVQRSPAPTPSSHVAGAAGSPPRDAAWEHRLREREHRELAPRLRALEAAASEGGDGLRPNFSVAAVPPPVGARLSLNVNAAKACADPDWRTGEVMAVTRTAIVVADVDNPAGGFSAAEYAAFGTSFDDRVFPVVTSNFGMPSDIDGNGRVVIFFTRAVNEMSRGETGVVAGFFFSRDLFARSGSGSQQTCAGSNQSEILYLMVPEPARAGSDPAFSKANVQRNAVGVLAHELQHLVNASHRLFVKRSGSFEETWLNEGLSHIAEELVGNHAAGIGRRENVDYARLRGSSEIWELFTLFHRSNFARLGLHLQQPGGSGLFDATGSLAGRGASWQFLRYAADRAGGDEAALWRALASGPSTGVRNLERVFGVQVSLWMRDWAISIHTDDVFPDIDPVWRQPSWNFRSVFGGMRGDGSYPLDFRALPADGGTDVAVAAGGAAYLGFGVPAHGRTEVRTSWGGGLTPPHRLLISVVRTR